MKSKSTTGDNTDMSITYDMLQSWATRNSQLNSLDDIKEWIRVRQDNLKVIVQKTAFSYDGFWFYDETTGSIRNRNNSFFQLVGYQEIENDKILREQPIIIQNEIGYLGIICKKINGVLHFLMQAKIEPGNVNIIQISPTIQATKSNFLRTHGGNEVAYLDYFLDASKYTIIVDQIQSEQSSRFYKKRNRNIIVLLDEDENVEKLDSHKWMTLGQIKELVKIDNLVNMDTRTVLSCIPFTEMTTEEEKNARGFFNDESLYESILGKKEIDDNVIQRILSIINDYRMYPREASRKVPLKSLKGWRLTENEIICKTPFDFKVIYCHIEIEGREVNYWDQPLIEANGMAVLGLFTQIQKGIRKYLIKINPEIGCFDGAELGPTIQMEPQTVRRQIDDVEQLFLKRLEAGEGILADVVLSEEGGRFYHEQNRNVIIEIDEKSVPDLPHGYFWLRYSELNQLVQYNNYLNIQLRNLLSLIDL